MVVLRRVVLWLLVVDRRLGVPKKSGFVTVSPKVWCTVLEAPHDG